MNKPTDFTESNALLAIVAGEPHQARLILEQLNSQELRTLHAHAQELADLCWFLGDKDATPEQGELTQ